MICFAGDYVEQPETVSAVFVGGTWDGEHRSLARHMPVIEVPVCDEPERLRVRDVSDQIRKITWHREQYVAQQWAADNERFTIYAHESLTAADVMRRLLERYVEKREVVA
jgi:hypothetical protein